MATKNDSARAFDLYAVGLGIMSVRHSTRETEDCIRASKHVLYVDHSRGIDDYLKGLCPKTTNLLDLYRDGQSRLETYRDMATAVIDAALDHPPVCFATYGHPTLYVYPTVLLRRAATALGLRMHVAAGISAFDTAIVDLGIDPGASGLQIYDATAVIVEERTLQPDVPCLLLQVDAVESALFTSARSTSERFMRLQKHLLKFYPAEHELISVYSSTSPIVPSALDLYPLRDFPERFASGLQSGTVFIPAIEKPSRRNERLEKELFDPTHLSRITSRAGR